MTCFDALFKEGILSGFRLVKISKVHLIKFSSNMMCCFDALFKEGILSGFRLVKISKVHLIKFSLNQDERKFKISYFSFFLTFIQLGIEIVLNV